MSRRSLEDGVDANDLSVQEEARRFVRGEASQPPGSESNRASIGERGVLPQMVGRKSLTLKLPPQVASDLKRLSLERQLSGVDPHTMQDMAEEAIMAWLKRQK